MNLGAISLFWAEVTHKQQHIMKGLGGHPISCKESIMNFKWTVNGIRCMFVKAHTGGLVEDDQWILREH